MYVFMSSVPSCKHDITICRHILAKVAAMSLLLSCTENFTSFIMKPYDENEKKKRKTTRNKKRKKKKQSSK